MSSRPESRFVRRRPGIGWLVALLVVPLLLAVIGWGGFAGDEKDTEVTLPSVSPSAILTEAPAPAAAFGRFSIVRNARGFVLGGQLPDEQMKTSLLEAMTMAMPGATIVDEFEVTPGVGVPDASALGGLFSVTPNVPDFDLGVAGGVVTLRGTAPSEPEKAAIESAAATAWRGLKIVNEITVG